jgi:hypothetical protein
MDGYQLIPQKRKELDRFFYGAFPDQEIRQQTDKEMKKLLKQYYKKNPTPELQAKIPLEVFVPSTSVFQKVRDTIADIAKSANMVIHLTKNPDGNISAQHYMTIIQKLSRGFYKALLFACLVLIITTMIGRKIPDSLKQNQPKLRL